MRIFFVCLRGDNEMKIYSKEQTLMYFSLKKKIGLEKKHLSEKDGDPIQTLAITI